MRESQGAFAVIRRMIGDEQEWLVQWNSRWNCYNFVGGHREEGESFFECLVREIREELGLHVGTDYDVEPQPCCKLEYVARSERAKEDTAYKMQLFLITLNSSAESTVTQSVENTWINRSEVNAQVTRNEQAVSGQIGQWLEAITAGQTDGT